MKVKRAEKYGFCSGVRIADLKVKRFAAAGGRGAILGQVVHNERVVEEMEKLGVRTIDEIGSVDEPTIVFSAHGVPPSFHIDAKSRGLSVLDTTCKFVYDIHHESKDALAEGCHIVIIGGKKSANTKHLWEICRESKPAYLVQGADDIDPSWFSSADVVGVTAGASTPDYVIDEVEARIASL